MTTTREARSPHNAGQTVTVQQISPMPVKDMDWGPITVRENWGRLFISWKDQEIIAVMQHYPALIEALQHFVEPAMPATEPQGLVENDTIDSFCLTLRRLVFDAYAERDRFGHIAATIRINALHHGATNAEVEAMLSGELSFINWIADKVESRHAATPAQSDKIAEAARVSDVELAAVLWREEAVNAGAPNSVAVGRTIEAFTEQSPELQARWLKFARAALRALAGKGE